MKCTSQGIEEGPIQILTFKLIVIHCMIVFYYLQTVKNSHSKDQNLIKILDFDHLPKQYIYTYIIYYKYIMSSNSRCCSHKLYIHYFVYLYYNIHDLCIFKRKPTHKCIKKNIIERAYRIFYTNYIYFVFWSLIFHTLGLKIIFKI